MATKSEKELPPNLRALWLKAASAVELRNHGYAISLLQALLKDEPEFLDGRKLLRKAEIAETKGKRSFFGGLSAISLKGGSVLKKDPKAAMELAEKELEGDPLSVQANMLLKDAAIALGLPETATFALETLADGSPKDTKILHDLGQRYLDIQDTQRAVETFRRIVELNPADLVAVKKEKDAAARHTMSHGGWDEVSKSDGKKDYRDLMKNKDEAVSLEQQNRVVKSDEMIEQQLAELGQRYEQEPQSIDVARKIAQLYEQKGDLENASQWFTYASSLTNDTDPSLARKVSDLRFKVIDNSIAAHEVFLAENPDHEEAPRVTAELAQMKVERAELLIAEAKKRVEKNPTDLQFRFELGEQLLHAHHYTEAIPELQRARQNPNTRIKAMYLLGLCYQGKSMLDFAVRTFAEAVKELSVMDNTKKDILYDLGLVYEQLEKTEDYIDCMKQIYEVDYGYKDVAQRVESSYGG